MRRVLGRECLRLEGEMPVIHVERIQERRRAMRVEEHGRVFVTEQRACSSIPGMDEFLAPLFGAAVNLSETGVLVEIEEPLPPGRNVIVHVDLEGSQLAVPGKVVRVLRRAASGQVHLAVRFGDLPEQANRVIRRVVEAGKPIPQFN